MKWRGRRQSTNVIDLSGQKPPKIPDGAKMFDGSIYHAPKSKDVEFNPENEKEMKVVRELTVRNNMGTTPTPTPKPKITKTQVTPGKWTTK